MWNAPVIETLPPPPPPFIHHEHPGPGGATAPLPLGFDSSLTCPSLVDTHTVSRLRCGCEPRPHQLGCIYREKPEEGSAGDTKGSLAPDLLAEEGEWRGVRAGGATTFCCSGDFPVTLLCWVTLGFGAKPGAIQRPGRRHAQETTWAASMATTISAPAEGEGTGGRVAGRGLGSGR